MNSSSPQVHFSRLLRVVEVAGMLGVSVATVYKLIRNREIPSVKVGKLLKIPTSFIEELLEDGKTVIPPRRGA
jgi:excisionase family DNA binding protein